MILNPDRLAARQRTVKFYNQLAAARDDDSVAAF